MAGSAAHNSALVQRANLNIAAAVVASFGAGASDSLIGRVTDDVRASHSVTELASAGGMSVVMGAVETAIARNAETNRPFNNTDSRAAQLAAHGGHQGGHWQHDGAALGRYGLLGAGRGSREAANDGGEGASGGNSGTSRGSGYTTMSGTGSEPAGSPFWGTAKGMMLTRGYANDNNMSWAPPDLMQMGRPALQAIKESGLKGDGYQALRKPSGMNLDNPTVVNLAKYFRENGGKANDAAKHMDQAQQVLHGENKGRLSGAIKAFADPKDGLTKEQKRDNADKAFDGIVASQPEATPQINQLRQDLQTKKGMALQADVAVAKSDATAKKDDSQGKKDGAEAKKDEAAAKKDDAETKRKDASNDDAAAKMAALLKKRQGTPAAPKSGP